MVSADRAWDPRHDNQVNEGPVHCNSVSCVRESQSESELNSWIWSSTRVCVGTRLFHHGLGLLERTVGSDMNGVSSGPHSFFTPGLCRWCCSSCQTTWTPHTCTGDDGNRGCISRASGELAEDKSPTSVQQGGQAIDDHNQREGGCASGRICLSWLSYPPNNSKLSCHIVMPSLVQLCRTWTVKIWKSRISIFTQVEAA